MKRITDYGHKFHVLIDVASRHNFHAYVHAHAQVSSPVGGWFHPEEVVSALSQSQGTPSNPSQPLPPSAINLVTSLMGCNPCEVLGSLRSGTGIDGRLALIGYVARSPTLGTGEDCDIHRKEEGYCGKVGDAGNAFRCSLEVAWDHDVGGVFVRRFGMERDKKRPRCVNSLDKVLF